MQAAPGSTLTLEKGTYHFYSSGALPRHFHISNHDQPLWHPISVPLVDLKNVTIDANGSLFLFHGNMLPVLIQDSFGVTLKNLAIDYFIPHHSEGRLLKVTDQYYEVFLDSKKYPHEIKHDWFFFSGEEDWSEMHRGGGLAFDAKTRAIVAGTSDIGFKGKLEELGSDRYRVQYNLKKRGLKAGDILIFRHGGRPHPAVTLYRAKNTTLEKVSIHQSQGMGLLAQRSENIHINGGGIYPRKETGRHFSTSADATHFSNCKGIILEENGLYENMMDDAINVHATCLRIIEIIDSKTIRLRYIHKQSIGFEVMLPGEKINFIHAKKLTVGESRTVVSMQRKNVRDLIVTLNKSIPKGIDKGDAVESADWHPSVIFRGNIVRNNRARGSLFTTPKSIVVENNRFEHIAGSAILFAGDANGWYESGACRDVLIQKNKFIDNLTSKYQFTTAIISIYPTVPRLNEQTEAYHRNIKIINNEFDTFDVPLLSAISTDNLLFAHNKIRYNKNFPAWKKPPFSFKHCWNIKIEKNSVQNPPKKWTLKTAIQLDKTTPKKQITFTP